MKQIRLLIAGLLCLVIFAILSYLILGRFTQSWDNKTVLYLYNSAGPSSIISSIMVYASKYGREYFWIPIVAIMLLFGKKETKLLGLELAGLFVVGIVLGEALKIVVFRERPFVVLPSIHPLVAQDTDSSFPSGHAIIVSIGAAFSLVKFRRKILPILFAIEAAIVCYSRVYVGVHFPTDVIAGILVGLFIVFLGLYVLDGRLRKLAESLARGLDKMLKSLRIPAAL